MPALRSSVAAAVAVSSSRRATPPSPSAGARSTPFTERLEQRAAHDVFDIPTTPRGNMRNLSVGSTCRPPGAQAFGAERVARGSNSAAPGARVCSAYAIGAARVARGGARSQRLPARRTGRAGVLVAPGRAGAQGAEPLGGPAQRLAPGRAGVQGAEPLGLGDPGPGPCIMRALATACCWRAELRLHRASIAVGARSLVRLLVTVGGEGRG